MYDTNKDGHIDFREFMIVLYIMSNGSPEENMKQIFRVFDINNDGTITLKELQKIVKDLFLLINETNADKASQEVLVKTAFHEMDENHDGAVTQSEFIEACNFFAFIYYLFLFIIHDLISSILQACMAQKKFS